MASVMRFLPDSVVRPARLCFTSKGSSMCQTAGPVCSKKNRFCFGVWVAGAPGRLLLMFMLCLVSIVLGKSKI